MKKVFAITASISVLLLAVNLQAYTIGANTIAEILRNN